jgi:hypothetical protein
VEAAGGLRGGGAFTEGFDTGDLKEVRTLLDDLTRDTSEVPAAGVRFGRP